MSSGFAKNEAKALQNTTNCATVNLYKRGACVKRAESGLYRPDPNGNTAQFPPYGLKHRSDGCGVPSALQKCSIMSGCGTRIVLRGKSPSHSATAAPASVRCIRHWRRSPLQHPVLSALSICRTSLAVSALRIMRYCHNKTKNPGTIFIPKSCRDLYYSMRSRLKFFAEAFFQKGWKGKLKINPCSFCWWPSCAGRGPGCACGCAGSPE